MPTFGSRFKYGSWFCFMIENQHGELVGSAKGTRYAHPDQPSYSGELSKIYLLPEYQRLGLGRRLVGHLARRFLAQGISPMLLFADAGNPLAGSSEPWGRKSYSTLLAGFTEVTAGEICGLLHQCVPSNEFRG